MAATVERLTSRICLADALFGSLANLGNEHEVFEARYLFSISEMAWIQAGLGSELAPTDISQVPRDKIFTIGDPRKFSDDELIQGRRDFLAKIAETHPITH